MIPCDHFVVSPCTFQEVIDQVMEGVYLLSLGKTPKELGAYYFTLRVPGSEDKVLHPQTTGEKGISSRHPWKRDGSPDFIFTVLF